MLCVGLNVYMVDTIFNPDSDEDALWMPTRGETTALVAVLYVVPSRGAGGADPEKDVHLHQGCALMPEFLFVFVMMRTDIRCVFDDAFRRAVSPASLRRATRQA